METPRVPLLEEMAYGIYSITGVYRGEFDDHAFGGWFRQGNCVEEDIMGGMLVARDGTANILEGGIFDPEQTLEFSVQYIHSQKGREGNTCDFQFEKKGELWIGTYKITSRNSWHSKIKGTSCKIQALTKPARGH
jgi:hypothetical protein